MLPKILLKFNDSDEKLKDVSEILKGVIKLTCPSLTFQCSGVCSNSYQTLAWYSEPVLPDLDAEFTDLELGLGPENGKRKCSGQDSVSLGSALERMSASSARDKTESPMSGVSARSDKVTEFLSEAANLMGSFSKQLSNLSDQMSEHSSKMSEDSSGGLADESSGVEGVSPDPSSEGHTSSSGVVVLSQEEDWDKETRGAAVPAVPASQIVALPSQPSASSSTILMEEEPVIIDTRVVRSSSSLESSPTETPEKVLKLNVTVGINFSDPAKDEKWKTEEEARRKNMKLNDLLVSENVALRQDRPEDINFAAKKDDTRGKKKSGNAAKLA